MHRNGKREKAAQLWLCCRAECIHESRSRQTRLEEVQSIVITAGGLRGNSSLLEWNTFLRKAAGCNLLTILAIHSMNTLLYALGEIIKCDATLQFSWPKLDLAHLEHW